MSAYSPGPWVCGNFDFVRDAKGNAVAAVYGGWGERLSIPEVEQANARLIAAAPQLLEALNAARPVIRAAGTGPTTNDLVAQIDAALALVTP
jgi:inactivated superfamily I helicase